MLIAIATLFAASAEETHYVPFGGKTLGVSPSVVAGTLAPAALSAGVSRDHLQAFAGCFPADAPPKELTLLLSVGTTGAVTATSTFATPEAPAVEACVQKVGAGMAFGVTEKPSRVQLRFDPHAKLDLSGLVGMKGVQLGSGGIAPAPAGSTSSSGSPPRPPYTPGPGVTVESYDVVILGALPKARIDEVVNANLGVLEACYTDAQAAPKRPGRVVVKFVVDKSGAVSSATVKSTTLNHEGVEACVTGAVSKWRFPAPEGGGVVIASYPFDFVPR